jgi:acyl-CoA thioester hydrolase
MNPVQAESPASGQMHGKTHVLSIRVYYEDTDAGGIMYHANYLRFAERGRTEMLRSLGIHQNDMYAQTGLAFAVYKADVHYMKPAKLDDVLLVETALLELTGASMRARQIIYRESEAGHRDNLVQFHAQVVCMNKEGHAARLPASLRQALTPYISEDCV